MAKRRRIGFTNHALLERMPERGITVAEVLQTLAWPAYEFPGTSPGTVESYGRTTDGRPYYVVTSRNRTRVITVVEIEEKRC